MLCVLYIDIVQGWKGMALNRRIKEELMDCVKTVARLEKRRASTDLYLSEKGRLKQNDVSDHMD
jgi:hypothetical protein